MLTDAEVILRLERMHENLTGGRNQEIRRDRYALKRAAEILKALPARLPAPSPLAKFARQLLLARYAAQGVRLADDKMPYGVPSGLGDPPPQMVAVPCEELKQLRETARIVLEDPKDA